MKKRLIGLIIVLCLFYGCSTYRFDYNITLVQGNGAKIGDIELLLETHKDRSDSMDVDAEADVSATGL